MRIEKFIDKKNLCLFNDNKPTYLHPATDTYISLDLSICYPTLLLDYEWKVHDDLCGSDHFLIFLNNIASGVEEPSEKWKLNKADWPSFKALCESEINETILKATILLLFYMKLRKRLFLKRQQKTRRRKSLGLTMIVKHLFKKGDKLYDNLILVQCFKI